MMQLLLLLLFCSLTNAANPTLEWTPNKLSVLVKTGGTDKFDLRYFSNTEFAAATKAPILLHLTFGDDAKVIAEQQKFIFSIAQQLNASLYVAEHRYFGESKIKAGDVYTIEEQLTDIGIDIVLADFKALVKEVRKDGQKVIVSGAGYAGELATILRLKDDEKLIFGSIISNAPLLLHQGAGLGLGDLDKQLDVIYKAEGCPMDKLKEGMTLINTATEANQKAIADALTIASDSPIIENKYILQNYLHRAYAGLVEQNLDVTSTIGTTLTFGPRPVKAYCDEVAKLAAATTDVDKLAPIKMLIDAYYQKSDLIENAHNYVVLPNDVRINYVKCTDDVSYHCTLGASNDNFATRCADEAAWLDAVKSDCKKLMPTLDTKTAVKDKKISELTSTFQFGGLENAIYIYGEYDPSKVGAIKTVDNAKNQYNFVIPKVTKLAHLIQPTKCDPINVKQLRYRVINLLNCWVNEDKTSKCDASNFNGALPDYVATSGNCDDELLAYPWGQDPGSGDGKTIGTKSPGGPGNPKTTTPSFAPSSMQLLTQLLIALGALILLL